MLNRRQLLTPGGSLTAGALAAGCAPGTTEPGGSAGQPGASTRPLTMPAFQPYTGLKPDLPALENGTSPYFAALPADPPTFTTGQPGSGGSIRCHTFLNSLPKPKPNQWWEKIESTLGAELVLEGAPIGDYPAKFQTMVAGNDLADMVAILPDQTPELSKLLEAKFADLTDHLSGDGIKDFPGLANIPSYCWDACIFGGRIRMLPIHRYALRFVNVLIRADVVERRGGPVAPKNGEEFHALMKAVSNPAEKTFATNNVHSLLDRVAEMMEVPNEWAVEGGKFVKDVETPQYLEAIRFVRQCWEERLIHPDAFDPNFSLQTQAMFNSGSIVLGYGSTWGNNAGQARDADPEAISSWAPTMTWDGSRPVKHWLTSGAPYLTGIKQGDDARVRELLGVANWFASPWGTKEYLLFRYGIEGHDYTRDDNGTPVPTADGKAENGANGLIYMGASALVHNYKHADIAEAEYRSEADGMENLAALPTVGLESATGQTKNAQLTKILQDGYGDIITGRKDVDSWSEVLATWRAKGGDQVRHEYEESLQSRG